MQLVSTVMVLRAFLPLIRKGEQKKIMFITSSLGSIERGPGLRGVGNTYSVLKAGLNM
jgi:NAD(P)-dependent dehydrogenase (short-subunit alcohol dehydrogenase family)